MMMTKQNLIFDIDGTLWDATHEITKAYNEVLKRVNDTYPLITDEMMAGIMGFLPEEIADTFFPYLSKEKRMVLLEQCFENENKHLAKHGGTLYPDVIHVLDLLSKQYNLYIVSNCQDGYVDALFTVHPIRDYFIDFECSGRTGLKKSDNIRLIMERNQMKQAIYIGDTQKDMIASKEAGIPFIYAAYGFGEVDSYDEIITSFKDLLSLFPCE